MQRVQAALKRQLQRRMGVLNEELAAKVPCISFHSYVFCFPLLERICSLHFSPLIYHELFTPHFFADLQAQATSDAKREREQVGVELYNLQHVLAKLQTQLEQIHDQGDGAADQRKQTESILGEAKRMQAQVQEELTSINRQGAPNCPFETSCERN